MSIFYKVALLLGQPEVLKELNALYKSIESNVPATPIPPPPLDPKTPTEAPPLRPLDPKYPAAPPPLDPKTPTEAPLPRPLDPNYPTAQPPLDLKTPTKAPSPRPLDPKHPVAPTPQPLYPTPRTIPRLRPLDLSTPPNLQHPTPSILPTLRPLNLRASLKKTHAVLPPSQAPRDPTRLQPLDLGTPKYTIELNTLSWPAPAPNPATSQPLPSAVDNRPTATVPLDPSPVDPTAPSGAWVSADVLDHSRCSNPDHAPPTHAPPVKQWEATTATTPRLQVTGGKRKRKASPAEEEEEEEDEDEEGPRDV